MLPGFSVKKPFTIIVAVVLVLILGWVSATKMQTILIPELNLPYIVVVTTDQGASPEEIETSVTEPIENALSTTSGMKSIVSVSQENMSMVMLEFTEDTDSNAAMISVRETLDLYEDYLPDGAGTPMLLQLNMDSLPVAVYTVDMQGADREELSSYVTDTVEPALKAAEGVASVNIMGAVEPQIDIVISQDKLDAANDRIAQISNYAALFSASQSDTANLSSLTTEQLQTLISGGSLADEVAENDGVLTTSMIEQVLTAQNLSYPNGYITDDEVDYLIRTGDKYADIDELANTLLVSIPDADIEIRLKDVADITRVDASDDTYTKVNGNDAVVVFLYKQSEQSTATVSHNIADKVTELEEADGDLSMVALYDQGTYIDTVVQSVADNLILGAILAVIVLLVFLRSWKLTGVVALSIPLSLVVAIIAMYFTGITFNLLSLSGLALGVGMLVDNSIVVIENIFRTRREGEDAKAAAVAGARQVSGAIIASTLTTIAVFVPFAFATGITKQLFVDLALTITYSLLASLLVALSFVPMMCAGALRETPVKEHRIFDKVKASYTRLLEGSLHHKAIPLVIVGVLAVGTIVAVTQMGTQFFPETDSAQASATVTFEQSATFGERATALDDICSIIEGIDGVDKVGVTMAKSSSTSSMNMLSSAGGDTTTLYLVLDDDRPVSSQEIARQIDERCAAAGYDVVASGTVMDFSELTGSGIEIVIKGPDLDELRTVADDVTGIVEDTPGTTEVSSGYNQSTPQIRVTVDKDAAIAAGITVYQVYQAIDEYIPTTKTTTTLSAADEDYPVIVSSSADVDPSLEGLRNLTVTSSSTGEEVPLTDIATIDEAQGYQMIAHDAQERTVTVTADIAEGYNVGKVGTAVSDNLAEYSLPSGYTIETTGEDQVIRDALKDLAKVLLMAIAFVYLVMVAQFQSFRYPLVIMFTLPLSYIGGIAALLICQMPLSIVGVVGLVMLTGIVVNNGIVFVDYANQMRAAGMELHAALIKTGQDRLRPILMTALTTIFGMLTMALAVGESAEMAQPMAVVVIGGLTFATFMTLIIVPIVYALVTRKDAPVSEGTHHDELPASARYDEIEVD